MSNFVMPTTDAITKLLAVLYGEDLETEESDDEEISDQYIAVFLDDEDKLAALCACDLAFVGYTGGGLSMIPAGGIEDMIDEEDLSSTLEGNFYEVMNICSKLMMVDSGAHLRLDKVLPPGEEGAAAVAELEGRCTKQSFEVEIPRYGDGMMTVVIT